MNISPEQELNAIGGEPLAGSGFENEPVTNDDGVTFLNGQVVLPPVILKPVACAPQEAPEQ